MTTEPKTNPPLGRVIVITSGKGGVGKTTSSAAISAALAKKGFRTVVIDFDVGLRWEMTFISSVPPMSPWRSQPMMASSRRPFTPQTQNRRPKYPRQPLNSQTKRKTVS